MEARLLAIGDSLAALGGEPGAAVSVAANYDSGWIVLRAGQTLLASAPWWRSTA